MNKREVVSARRTGPCNFLVLFLLRGFTAHRLGSKRRSHPRQSSWCLQHISKGYRQKLTKTRKNADAVFMA